MRTALEKIVQQMTGDPLGPGQETHPQDPGHAG